MSVLNQLSYFQNRNDEAPNQELARMLVQTMNKEGIQEIADHLKDPMKPIRHDCIKVLYEIGYLDPEWIGEYTEIFLALLQSKDNRMVWGAMTALSTLASLKAGLIFENLETIQSSIEDGSVITADNGIAVLAATASVNDRYGDVIFPYLINWLRACRSKEVPQHAEKISVAVGPGNLESFCLVLNERMKELTPAQTVRVKKLLRRLSQ